MKYFRYFGVNAILIAIGILINSCAVNPVTGKKQLMFVSEQQEIALGKDYDPQVASTFGVYEDPKLQAFIDSKGAELGKLSHRPNMEYHFRLLDSPVINAFAVPGGYVYLTRGILAQINNEAELMGIMGHEIGHIAARHSAQQMTKQKVTQALLIGGMIASKEFRQFADAAMQGLQLLFLSFSRENEREADKLGVEYSTRIGYDAHKMADFFNALQKMQLASDHAGIPTFMSSHPDPGDRYNDVNRRAARWQDSLKLGTYLVNQENYLKMIDGIVYGEDPRQGYVESNIFYHPAMKFSFPVPSGWKTVNSPLQVQMIPPDEKAMMIFTMCQQKELEQATAASIQQLGLTIIESKKSTINGMPAIGVVSEKTTLDQQTGQQSSIRVLSSFIDYKGQIFVFHGITIASDFPLWTNQFEATMINFKELKDPSKINVVPKRIQVRQVAKTGTLAEAFAFHKVPQAELENLALLNNMKLTDRVEAKKLIKIIGK